MKNIVILFIFCLGVSPLVMGANEAWNEWNKPGRQQGGVSRDLPVNGHNDNWSKNPKGSSGWRSNDAQNKEEVKRKVCSDCGTTVSGAATRCSACEAKKNARNSR